MKETGNTISEWFGRIYGETDVGRSVAVTIAGVVAAMVYWVADDWVFAALSLIITFPMARLTAAMVHGRWTQRVEARSSEEDAKRLWDQLCGDERQVVGVFIVNGGCVVTWRQMNEVPWLSKSTVESLIAREFVAPSISADGVETFVLDPDLFDLGQSHWEPPF